MRAAVPRVVHPFHSILLGERECEIGTRGIEVLSCLEFGFERNGCDLLGVHPSEALQNALGDTEYP